MASRPCSVALVTSHTFQKLEKREGLIILNSLQSSMNSGWNLLTLCLFSVGKCNCHNAILQNLEIFG